MLDVLDRELETRELNVVRYADYCNIYVRSQRAGERVIASVERFLAKRLKLKINKAKSAVARPSKRKFLGFSFTKRKQPRRCIAVQSLALFRSRVRELTRRNRGKSLAQIVKELSVYLIGWRGYFGFCETPSELRDLDKWIRRRHRHRLEAKETRDCPLCRAATPRRRPGLGGAQRRQPHGPWRLSMSPALTIVLSNAFFTSLGLASLADVQSRSKNLLSRINRL